ncbi:MAG TPA: molybdopterin-dependent oxidoreductase [Pirellulales bacterium]|nr:molybdopterin-dependent oxidoreductase [Pirellulales bacterium]
MLTGYSRGWCLAAVAVGLMFALALSANAPGADDTKGGAEHRLTVKIRNDAGAETRVEVSPEVWEKLPRATVSVPRQEGGETEYAGVALAEVLKLVKAPLGKELRGKMLAKYVLVNAADGYRVVFSLAEVDPESTEHVVLLADRRDDRPLDAKEGPYRIIVPAEKKHARWVRQVTSITLETAPADTAN